MAGNRVVNFTPPGPEEPPGWTQSSGREGGRRPDDRKGEGRTYANPAGLRAAPEARACPTSSPAYSRPGATRPAPRLVRGRAAPFNPPQGRPKAARASPAPWQGPGAPCTLAYAGLSHLRRASSGVRGQTAPGDHPRRCLRRTGAMPRKSARRWAVPCHEAWQGTPRSVGASGSLKPCPRCAAGRLDPASAPAPVPHLTSTQPKPVIPMASRTRHETHKWRTRLSRTVRTVSILAQATSS